MLNPQTINRSYKRTYQPAPQTEQESMWYSPIPLNVLWGIYARQSTPAQVIQHFDADLGVSGTLPIDKRTGLQELVELIKANKIKAVLVYQISRLFRDDTGVEYNTFAKICREHNCILMTADGMVGSLHGSITSFVSQSAFPPIREKPFVLPKPQTPE